MNSKETDAVRPTSNGEQSRSGSEPDVAERTSTAEPPLVSIIIPCYNHAHFVPEAIESALAQTHPRVEVVVVDDGSTDNTSEVAARYGVLCVRQKNQGLSGARNSGVRASRGDYVMFLDADDRLAPDAVENHLKCFAEHPEAGFVVGNIDLMRLDGSYLRSPRWPDSEASQYEQLLQASHPANTIAVMMRLSVLESVGEFKTSLPSSEDYEMLLRVARSFEGVRHSNVVAHYRRHQSNMSRNGVRMLQTMHEVLKAQRPYVRGNPRLEAALRKGKKHWFDFYGGVTMKQIFAHLRRGNLLGACRALFVLLWYVRARVFVIPWKFRKLAFESFRNRILSFVRKSSA